MSHFLLAMDLLEEKRLPNVQSFHQFAPTNFETILSRQKPIIGPKKRLGICYGIALKPRFRPFKFEKKQRLIRTKHSDAEVLHLPPQKEKIKIRA